jgi:predicted  nucleic acid-binding Zn-ribbon protein
VKVSANQLQDLLELTQTDQELARSRNQIEETKQSKELSQLNVELMAASSAFIDAKNASDAAQTELDKIATDLATVEARIERDKRNLENSSSAKDAQGLQSELQTLAKRQSDLEDVSLAIMEQLAVAKVAEASAAENRAQIEAQIATVRAAVSAELMKLTSGLNLQAATREQLAGRIPHELLELYAQKSKRGVPVGRLVTRECGACHMNITASAYTELAATPADQLITCPECSAILVR